MDVNNESTRNDVLGVYRTDTAGGEARLYDGATLVASFTLQSPSFSAPATSSMTLQGTPLTATAAAATTDDTTPLDFRLYNSGATLIATLTAGVTGSGAEAIVDAPADTNGNPSISNGQEVRIISATLNHPIPS